MHGVFRRLALSLLLPTILLSLGLVVADAAAVGNAPRGALPTAVSVATTSPGKLVIAVPPGTDLDALEAALARSGAVLERWLPELGLALVNIPIGAEAQAAQMLRADPLVDFVAEHTKSVRIADVPLDQYFTQQWGMTKVNGPQAWDVTWGDRATVIAVIDTGVNYLQQDLRAQTWINPGETVIDPDTGQRVCDSNGVDDDGNGYVDDCRGWNFPDRNGNPDDGHGHGTAVTGIAVATTNNYDPALGVYAGVAGMARGARYMALRALDNYGQGYAIDVAQAIEYAANMGAQVINLSLDLPTPNPDPNTVEILRRAVEYAQAKNALVVGASGNLSYGMVFYPARFPGVLAVGASTQADTRASFSNYGDRLDLVAPGVGIFSTLRQPGFNSYGLFNGLGNGTSFATPHVAGVAALVRGLRPDFGHATVRDLITATVTDLAPSGFDLETGWGRLNAFGAVYSATTGLGLHLFADSPTVSAGAATTVTVWVVAPSGAPAGFGGRVALTATTGTIGPGVVTVDGTGRASAIYTAPVGATQATITATLGHASAILPISLTSGQPASLDLAASSARIAVGGGHATITAFVRDEGGSSVADGITVTFTTTLGSVAPQQVATSRGSATTILTSGALTGTALVEAAAGGVTGTVTVAILGAGSPLELSLAAEPPTLIAGGLPSTVTATVLDAVGLPVPDGVMVQFGADSGSAVPAMVPTIGGQASMRFTPGTISGAAHITARAGQASGTLVVPILPGDATTVTMQATPAVLSVGYNQIASLDAWATDRFGNPIADGTPLVFASSLGLATPPVTTTVGGHGRADFLAEFVAGTSHITVTVGHGIAGYTSVDIRAAQPASLSLTVGASSIPVGGQPVNLAATVRDEFGNAVEDGTLVAFATNLGNLRMPGNPASTITLTVPTQSGLALAQLVSGTQAGQAQVRASTAPNLLDIASIAFQSGPPAAPITLTVQPPSVSPGAKARLTVTIRDQYGNPVVDGTMAHFAASRGSLDPLDAPTHGGQASTSLVADDQPGIISIVAISGGISTFGSLEVGEAKFFLPLIVR